MRSLLPVNEHGHWSLWSRDQVVVPEDNDLAEEDWPWIGCISAQSSLCFEGMGGHPTGQPWKYTVPAEQHQTANSRDDSARTVSSANACKNTPCLSTMSARSAVYTMNSSGPNTEPCGTEQKM